MSPPRADVVECLVVGGGPTGLAAAAALAHANAEVAIIVPPLKRSTPAEALPGSIGDGRTAALFLGSIALLRNLGVWSRLAHASAPIKGIRIVDDTGRLLRAPEVLFDANEIGLPEFGANVPNDALATSLQETLDVGRRVRIIASHGVVDTDVGPAEARVTTAEGRTISAKLLVAADGRNSVCRTGAGIGVRTWSYPQCAVVSRFFHGAPHRGLSTEFHRRPGPCTTVPLPGDASSLVWVEPPAVARRLAALDDGAFAHALEERLQGLLGPISQPAPREVFPLLGLRAKRLVGPRIALVGEAAHVIPPIGAQGLNLGLRDVAALADCVALARRRGEDPGSENTLASYDRARAADIAGRIAAVDALNRSLLSSLLPIHLARGLGLHLLGAIPALKRELIRVGLNAPGELPTLMRDTHTLGEPQ